MKTLEFLLLPLSKFLATREKQIPYTETYRGGPYQTSTMKLFCENNSWLLSANYFRKKAPSLIFDRVLNTPLLPMISVTYG